MGVGARPPERTDAGNPSRIRRLPGYGAGRDSDRLFLPGDMRIGSCEVQMRWNLVMLEGQNRFNQTRDTGGPGQVSDVRFHRANEQVLPRLSLLPQHIMQRLKLDWIAQRRAR